MQRLHGHFLGQFVTYDCGVDDPATLEAMACRDALALAQDLQLQNFIVASDSKQVTGDISKASHGSYEPSLTKLKPKLLYFSVILLSKVVHCIAGT